MLRNIAPLICSKCRTATQEHAFSKAATALENFFFKSNSSGLMTITGVAGSGKSFVSSKFAIFASLLLDDQDYAYDSPEAVLIRESEHLQSDFAKSVMSLEKAVVLSSDDPQHQKSSEGFTASRKKRVHTLAYSGAAAGVLGGFTIHHALGLNRNQLSADVARGILDLPMYKSSSLDSFWEGIKAIVIDEIYFCDASFLNVIHQRLCQIKQSTKPFGGLFVLVLGDPQQIKALSGDLSTTVLQKYLDVYTFIYSPASLLLACIGICLLPSTGRSDARFRKSRHLEFPL